MAEIVAADDDPDVRSILQIILDQAGHSVTMCDNGAALVAQVRARRPDVVVTDNQMPGMTGLQAREALRARPETADIPVVLHTAADIPAAGRVLGDGDQLVPKPFRSAELLEAVQSALRYAATPD
jgi:CheY-like chemotaxis protein